MTETKTIIKMEDLSFSYDQNLALDHVSLIINKGDFLGIVGPNGSGKSTLLKLLLRLLPLQKGKIHLFGEPIEQFKNWEKIGYVSQKANSFNRGFPATVYEVVRSGLTKKTGLFRLFPKDTKERVIQALKDVEMEGFLHRNIAELSGGQQQRVFIARALVASPEVILLDEPTVGIDEKRVSVFYQLLKRLNKELGITLILISHDMGNIEENVSHIACLNRTLHFHGTVEEYKQWKNREVHPTSQPDPVQSVEYGGLVYDF